MITALARRVAQELDEVTALERAQSQAEDIRATLDALDALRQQVDVAVGRFRLLRERLPQEQARATSQRLTDLAQTLQRSREEFERQRRQVIPLESAKTQARQISEDLANGWREATQAQAGPLLQLLALVERLPELRERLPVLAQLRTQVITGMSKPPQNEENLAQFGALCEGLEEQLVQVHGLSPDVKAFLSKVVAGSATLADLSDDVLAWCRQGERAAALRITFPAAAE